MQLQQHENYRGKPNSKVKARSKIVILIKFMSIPSCYTFTTHSYVL